MNKTFPHIIVPIQPKAEQFLSHQALGRKKKLREVNRFEHGKFLLAQITGFKSEFSEIIEKQRSDFPESNDYGVTISFEIAYTGSEPIQSLEAETSGIRVLSAKRVEDSVFVSVFVPEKKLVILENKIKAYLDIGKDKTVEEKDKDGNVISSSIVPKNALLISHIEKIGLATLSAMWTDADPIPDGEEKIWWEVWLWCEQDYNETFNDFVKKAKKIGIITSEFRFDFPQRIITTVLSTQKQLASSLHVLNHIAEIKKHRPLASFITELSNSDQYEWLAHTAEKIKLSDHEKTAICILDTGVNHGHPLLKPIFLNEKLATITDCESSADRAGHGTCMAGIAAYGDLAYLLADEEKELPVNHHLESVKILKHDGDNSGKNHASTLESACETAELFGSDITRHYCLAVTTGKGSELGTPSAYSSAIDKIATGYISGKKRLFILSGGNIGQSLWGEYDSINKRSTIHDPSQSWNALTVGAYTKKCDFDFKKYPGHKLLARPNDLSPSSTTSLKWKKGSISGKWPYKPDIVFEGGNALRTPTGEIDAPSSLALVSTNYRPHHNYFTYFDGTSAACAEAARMAAKISSRYPDLWPETIRALLVHSARWNETMWQKFRTSKISPHKGGAKDQIKNLVRYYGWGQPSLDIALNSLESRLTLVYESELQPFGQFVELNKKTNKSEKKIKSNEMHLHALPFPSDVLEGLGSEEVILRITLSYFIDPNPSSRGREDRYKYESCGLRFALSAETEYRRPELFRYRINKFAEQEENGERLHALDEGWYLGTKSRNLGSLHMDIWRGPAEVLAKRNMLAIFPTMGWWRSQKKLSMWNAKQRYSLVVSISSKNEEIKLYSSVKNIIDNYVMAEEVNYFD